MKEIVSNKMLFYNEKTGQREPVDLLRGESAYEAAVRLGQTTLSEEEWLEEYNANRDAAISAINARQAEATQAVASAGATQVNSIAAKGAETLATIPEDYAKLSSDVTTLTEDIARNTAPPIVPTATGSIATITDGAARPAVELISHIEPVETGTGEKGPNNPWTISGWNSVTAQRTGKNLFDGDVLLQASGWAHEGGVYNGPGSALHGVFSNGVSGIEYKPNTQYTFSFTGKAESETSEAYCIIYYAEGGNSGAMIVNSTSEKKYTLTSAAGKTVDRLCWSYGARASHMWLYDLQLEEGNTPTAYVPYQGKTLTATLPETVYGGKLDWTTGVLIKDAVQDGATMSVNGYQSTHDDAEHAVFSFELPRCEHNEKPNIVCSHFPYASHPQYHGGKECCGFNPNEIYSEYFYIVIRKSRLSSVSVEGMNAWLRAQSDFKLVYVPEQVERIQLTPQQLSTLYGTNNVWSDCGSTELSYIADTKLYIDQKLAAIAAATL